jgi:lipoate-protein ligase A
MVRLELTRPTLAENLALDEALLLEAAAGGPAVLRFWHWPSYAVVVGAGGKLSDEVRLEQCAADRVEVARRASGGGTVLLGPGCLLYSLVLPMAAHPALGDLNASYRHIMGRLAAALAVEVDGVAWNGISDLVCGDRKSGDRKFSGNAQQRKRGHLLHHGTLLYAFDLPMIDRYLRHPPRMPDYRRNRPHSDFVANIAVAVDRLKELLINAWDAHDTIENWPRAAVERLLVEKYGQEEWRQRR